MTRWLLALLLLVGCSATPPAAPARSPAPVVIAVASPSPSASVRPPDFRACVYRGADTLRVLPDPSCTPGAIDPAVTQANIHETICAPGYSAKVRPPTSYTTPLKRRSMLEYQQNGQPPSAFELDHLISLELGGAPRDPDNLWPEPGGTPNSKDHVENELLRRVCLPDTDPEHMTLAEAQHRIATDWRTALD